MSDPLRTDGFRAPDAAPDADRDAKIEQLLLAGLDHYFAAQHEQAINVWTRALFLDRTHPKARAYIERARSALAELQRHSEELLHTGAAAFDRGDGVEARRLIQAAIDGGGPTDEAFALLDWLDRLQQAPAPAGVPADRPLPGLRRAAAPRVPGRTSRAVVYTAFGLALLVAAAIGGALAATHRDELAWPSFSALSRVPVASPTAPGSTDVVLPLPRRGESALSRARALAAGGHLHDAIAALDAVRPTDPERSDADCLRADVQRQLLGLTTVSAGTSSPDGTSSAAAGGSIRRVP